MRIDKGRIEYFHYVIQSGSVTDLLDFLKELVEEDQDKAKSINQQIRLGDLSNAITQAIETVKRNGIE